MARAQSTIATFSSGELDPRMRGRTDVKQYLQGALRMRNFRQLAQGGVQTRPGTDFIEELPADGSLIPFVFSESVSYLLVFVANKIIIYENIHGWRKLQEIGSPYNLEEAKALDVTQFSDTMIIVHKQEPPKILKRITAETFEFTAFEFDVDDKDEYIFQPYHKFVSSDTHLRANNPAANPTYKAGDSITIGIYRNNGSIGVTDFWNTAHIGLRISILDPSDNVLKEVEVTALQQSQLKKILEPQARHYTTHQQTHWIGVNRFIAPFGAILLLLALERAGYGSTAPRHGPLLYWLVKRNSFLILMLGKH